MKVKRLLFSLFFLIINDLHLLIMIIYKSLKDIYLANAIYLRGIYKNEAFYYKKIKKSINWDS